MPLKCANKLFLVQKQNDYWMKYIAVFIVMILGFNFINAKSVDEEFRQIIRTNNCLKTEKDNTSIGQQEYSEEQIYSQKIIDKPIAEPNDCLEKEKDNTSADLQMEHRKSPFANLHSIIVRMLLIFDVVLVLTILLGLFWYSYKLKKKGMNILGMINNKMVERLEIENTNEEDIKNAQVQCEKQNDCQPIDQKQNIISEQCPSSESNEKRNEKEIEIDLKEVHAFAEYNDNWVVVGASVIGNSHVSMGIACQDSSKYVYLKDGWGIAITSDGAGSAKHSDIGSRIAVERGLYYFQSVINQKRWIEKEEFPTEAEWTNIAYYTLKAIRDDMENYASTRHIELNSLNTTIIVVVHSPYGFLVSHIGDGRAGYKSKDSDWCSLITPHKGEEANQTIFLTSDFWNLQYYVMSGVMVPESHVVLCNPLIFTLMTDGCERTAWRCNTMDENTGMFSDPNKPFARFFDPLLKNLASAEKNEGGKAELRNRWAKFIINGNNSFKDEPDDKTLILGTFK